LDAATAATDITLGGHAEPTAQQQGWKSTRGRRPPRGAVEKLYIIEFQAIRKLHWDRGGNFAVALLQNEPFIVE
jgi:hypothetical protein